MSRIGKLPISIPAGVTVTLKENVVTVKGPKGELSQYVDPAINVAIEDGHVTLSENENAMLDNSKQKHAFHGLYRSLVHNMVVGVSEGYEKLHDDGYKFVLDLVGFFEDEYKERVELLEAMHLNSLGNLIALQLAAVSDYYNNIQIVHSITIQFLFHGIDAGRP